MSGDGRRVLTGYGGDWVAHAIIGQAKRPGIPVVFALHNFAYEGADLFRPAQPWRPSLARDRTGDPDAGIRASVRLRPPFAAG